LAVDAGRLPSAFDPIGQTGALVQTRGSSSDGYAADAERSACAFAQQQSSDPPRRDDYYATEGRIAVPTAS
jgi:hypothetical protein